MNAELRLSQVHPGKRDRRAISVDAGGLPPVSPLVIRWFTSYSRRYLKRHFHSFRVSQVNLPDSDFESPLVIYLNHASWWDPLVVLLLTHEVFPMRTFFAPMDARALQRYGFFRRIGCFGVESGTLRGARQFLARSLAALAFPNGGLCVTPQGRFADARERPVRFEGGLGQLAARSPDTVFLPLAFEYVFWEERLPEVLAGFGTPITFPHDQGAGSETCTRILEEQLESAQEALAADSRARDVSRFKNLLSGDVGVGGVYDSWRRVRSWLRGERFVAGHSESL